MYRNLRNNIINKNVKIIISNIECLHSETKKEKTLFS